MAATYTTTAKVAELIQIPAFDGSTTPTSTVVTNLIERAQDWLDDKTGHAWRPKTVTKEYREPSSGYVWSLGIRFKLAHRTLTTFASGTDLIEVWDGSSWVDYVATKTAGRADDYWVDETNGIAFLTDRSSIYPHGVRFTYRYGESSVPGHVEDCITKMVAIDILNQFEDLLVFPDDGVTNKPSHLDRMRQWQSDIDKIIDDLMEFDMV